MFYIAILVSVMAGVSIVLARTINANLAKTIGLFSGTFFNFVTGLFTSLIFIFFSKESLNMSNIDFSSIPIWAYLGGLVGVIVIVLSNHITPKISAFYLTLLIFIGQLFVGIILDYFTLGELSIGKVLGGILVLLGLTYNLLLDKKKAV